MKGPYTFTRNNVTPITTNDVATLVVPSNKACRIKRIRITGESSASTVMRTVIQRSTGGTTPGGTLTPSKASTTDPAADTLVYSTWGGQPTLSGSPHYNESWNSFGGGFDLVLDGREIFLGPTEQLSIRNTVGTGLLSIDIEVEEL